MRKCFVEGYDKVYDFHQWICGQNNFIFAIVEDESGYVKVVGYDKIRFANKLDRSKRAAFAIDNKFVTESKEFMGWGQKTRPTGSL